MLRPDNSLEAIFIYRPPVDFRKAANGLAAIVEQELGHNPFSGQLYLFTNRHRNKIKGLYWELWKRFHRCHYARFEIMHGLHTALIQVSRKIKQLILPLMDSLSST